MKLRTKAKHDLRTALSEVVTGFERGHLRRVLDENGGNVSRSARDLGISRKCLQIKMKAHGLREPDAMPDPAPAPILPAPIIMYSTATVAAPAEFFAPAPTWEPGSPLPEPPAVVGARWIRLERDGGFSLVDEDLHPMLSAYRWRRNDGGYAQSGSTLLHHLVIGRPSHVRTVDHWNRNRLDNRRKNLRFATKLQNAQNRGEPLPFGVNE